MRCPNLAMLKQMKPRYTNMLAGRSVALVWLKAGGKEEFMSSQVEMMHFMLVSVKTWKPVGSQWVMVLSLLGTVSRAGKKPIAGLTT